MIQKKAIVSRFSAVLLSSFFLFLLSTFSASAQSVEEGDDRPMPVQNIYAEKSPEVETVADTLEYLRNEKKIIAKGNVVITYGGDKLTADYAEVETDTKKALARGHVIVFKNDAAVARGETVEYDFASSTGIFPDGTVLAYPWRCEADEMQKVDSQTVVAQEAVFTTCKGEKPPYEIHAKKVTIHENDKMVATNVTIYSLGKPIFWWPYLVVPLQRRSIPFSVTGGYNSEFGAYIETTKGFSLTENLYGELHADYRAKRGFGGGADLNYDYGAYGQGDLRGYWTQDERAPTPGALTLAGDPNPYGVLEERDRGRLAWRHRTDFDEYSNVQLRYERLADEFFLQDFFEKEHRAEIEPQSFVTLTKNSETYGSYVHVTKQMNDFERLVERLPEVRFDWKNQPFFSPNIYYENHTSYANLAKRFGRMNYNEDVNRFDHLSEWYIPLTYEGVNIMPFFSARGTYYSRDRFSNEDHFRTAAGFGVDIRDHYYRTFDVNIDKYGIEANGIRHVVEPYLRYEALRTSLSDEQLSRFDSVDTLDDQDLVTFGVENRIQTKRVVDGRMQRVDIVSLNTFLGFSPNPHNVGHGTSFTAFGQELVLRPYSWLQYRVDYQYDFLQSRLSFFNQDIIAFTDRFRFLIGHRYITADVEGRRRFDRRNFINDTEKGNQLVFDARYQLNDLWWVGGYVRFDAEGEGLEEWQVSATRDMDCLIFDIGYNVRNSSIDSSNRELFFNLRLKDYPVISLRGGGSRASFAEPRIGETVAGANQYGSNYYYANEAGGNRI